MVSGTISETINLIEFGMEIMRSMKKTAVACKYVCDKNE